MKINILAIDVGRNTGYCYKDQIGEESGTFKCESYEQFYAKFGDLCALYKPKTIVVGKPNVGFGYRLSYETVRLHFGLLATIALYCERHELYMFELNDNSARKKVFGKALKKAEVWEKIGTTTNDEADAIVLARAMYQDLLVANT